MTPELLPSWQIRWPFLSGFSPLRAHADRQGGPELQRRRILIVEDEYFIAIELDRWLEEAGHEVIAIAASARQAVTAALDGRPDLVVMDIRLAGERDGVDAALEIYTKTGIRCMFASAHADPRTKNRAAGAEPLGWLAKPYSRAEFMAALETAIAAVDSDGD